MKKKENKTVFAIPTTYFEINLKNLSACIFHREYESVVSVEEQDYQKEQKEQKNEVVSCQEFTC